VQYFVNNKVFAPKFAEFKIFSAKYVPFLGKIVNENLQNRGF
jgi:hypothetical protein